PSLKGEFVQNRVSIVSTPLSVDKTPTKLVSLDPLGTPGITEANTVGQPFALAFSPTGEGFIAGLLTDNVLVLDQNGNYVMEWDLPDGSIPRGILFHPTLSKTAYVYLWGLNEVRSYRVSTVNGTAALQRTHHLRHDPTPANVA